MAKRPRIAGRHRGPRRRETRAPAHKRGYGKRWERFRNGRLTAWIRERAEANLPLCEDCEGAFDLIPVELHHKKKVATHPELQYEPSNLQWLCKEHHSRRTMRGE